MATISACPVWSKDLVTSFVPMPSTMPPRATTAPNGPPPLSTLRSASSTASVRNSMSSSEGKTEKAYGSTSR